MKTFRQFLNEDTIDTKIIYAQLKIWLRIDGGDPLYWEVVIFKGDEVISTERFDSEQKALVRYHEII